MKSRVRKDSATLRAVHGKSHNPCCKALHLAAIQSIQQVDTQQLPHIKRNPLVALFLTKIHASNFLSLHYPQFVGG